MATSYNPQQDQPTQNKPSNGSFDINSQITNALHQGMSPQDITTYLSNKGYGQAAKDYFGIKDPGEKKGIFARIGEDLGKRTQDAASALANKDNKLTGAETILRTTGALAGGINDIIGEGISSGIDALPDNVKKVGSDILNSPVGQVGLNLIKKGTDIYNNFSENHPQAAKDIESVANIASLVPTGKVAKVGSEVAEQGLKTAGRTALKVGEEAVDLGKNVATKASDVITPLEKGVQNVLEQGSIERKLSGKELMSKNFERYAEQADKALSDFSQATPMELAGNRAEDALKQINEKLNSIGQNKAIITNKLSKKPVGSIVADARSQLRTALSDRAGLAFNKEGDLIDAAGRVSKVSDPTDLSLLKTADNKLAQLSNNPTFQQVDDAIDFLQDQLYKRNANVAVPVNGQVEGILKKTISDLNSKLKDIGGKEYRNLNEQYSQIIDTRDLLNKGLGSDANKGASLLKQLFSPAGTMSRKLFAEVKNLTGIDLAQEATLAKFTMENVGDVRQASLLEQILKGNVPINQSGIIRYAADKVLNKLQDPIGKARRIIEKAEKSVK